MTSNSTKSGDTKAKPDGRGRNLGVATVTDRFVQQAIAQVLMPIYEEQIHDHSYGFCAYAHATCMGVDCGSYSEKNKS